MPAAQCMDDICCKLHQFNWSPSHDNLSGIPCTEWKRLSWAGTDGGPLEYNYLRCLNPTTIIQEKGLVSACWWQIDTFHQLSASSKKELILRHVGPNRLLITGLQSLMGRCADFPLNNTSQWSNGSITGLQIKTKLWTCFLNVFIY